MKKIVELTRIYLEPLAQLVEQVSRFIELASSETCEKGREVFRAA